MSVLVSTLTIAAYSIAPVSVAAQAKPTLEAAVDAIASAPIAAGKVAGMSVVVTRKGRTVVDKAYGLADLELNVATPRGASYEIGSVTKQFTAAAVLLLAQRGRLSLDDDITKYLTGYPTHGQRITIRHLLTHTSGIKGYTELPEFDDWVYQKKPRESFVPVFAEKPLDFEPGAALVYNNSGYFLLGLIIEKITGTSYADFVRVNLFEPLGMRDSYYCSETVLHRNHAHGYDTAEGQLVLKGYLDHTWPYSAGSLCSTAPDLAVWVNALHGGRVLTPESYRAMITPAVLNDGTRTRYAFGLGISDVNGRRLIAHGGGINGFLSETEYYPDAELAVVVLQNTAGPVDPTETARKIADAVLGPVPEHTTTFAGDLSPFVGVFEGVGRGHPTKATVAIQSGALTLSTAGPPEQTEPLKHLRGDTFGYKDALVTFEREGSRVTRLRLDTIGGHFPLKRTEGSAGAAAERSQSARESGPEITIKGRTYTQLSLFQRNIGAPEDQTTAFTPHRIIGNIYYVGTNSLASFLITTPEGHILINSSYERNVPLIQRSVEQLGFKFSDVRILLGSHAHADHQEGDALVKQLTGAKLVVMKEDVPALEMMTPGDKPHIVDQVIHDGESVTLGGTTLVAHLTPGHTRGCTTWTMKVTDEGRTYDVVIIGSFGVNPGFRLVGNTDVPHIADEFRRAFATARTLPCDVPLASHPAMFGMKEKYAALGAGRANPYVDPEGYQIELDITEAMFKAVLASQERSSSRQ
jgi:CubicO group peptidase (beta-lactamase class C family)/glyoxylase-like metal-dependent hydrolase (beta-lactamase superfamily II)